MGKRRKDVSGEWQLTWKEWEVFTFAVFERDGESTLSESEAAESSIGECEYVNPDHFAADWQHLQKHNVGEEVDYDHIDTVP